MKPRVFIGSSSENIEIVNAIAANIERDSHPQPWTAGVFGLSDATTTNLMFEVENCDFGIFVFAPDDIAEMRGDLLKIPRDNVVYELGLFSGALGVERCFFVIPRDAKIRLPSDLLGLTPGTYDSTRPVREYRAALTSFCDNVVQKVIRLGSRSLSTYEQIVSLASRYESYEYVENSDLRVKLKEEAYLSMISICQNRAISKHRLASAQGFGFYVALAASVVVDPERDDARLLLLCDPGKITCGNAQHKMIDAMEKLLFRGFLKVGDKVKLARWASRMPNPEAMALHRMHEFSQR